MTWVMRSFGGESDRGVDVAVDAPGRIVVLARSPLQFEWGGFPPVDRSVVLLRYRTTGCPDTSFGTLGTVVLSRNEVDLAPGRLLVIGTRCIVGGAAWDRGSSTWQAFLGCVEGSGAPCPGYGPDGLSMVAVEPGFTPQWAVSTVLVRLPDGTLVQGCEAFGGEGEHALLLLFRDPETGALLPDHGDGGIVTTALPASFSALDGALDAAGRLVLGGLARTGWHVDGLIPAPVEFSPAAVARVGLDGSPDASFGEGGLAHLAFGGIRQVVRDVHVLPDGRILLGAETSFIPNVHVTYQTTDGLCEPTGDLVVARLTAGGEPDPSFGAGGRVRAGLAGRYTLVRCAGIDPQGPGILVAGNANGPLDPGGGVAMRRNVLAQARFHPDGAPDAGFGSGGLLVGTVSEGPWVDELAALARLLQGPYAGWHALVGTLRLETVPPPQARIVIGLARPDGSLDPGFAVCEPWEKWPWWLPEPWFELPGPWPWQPAKTPPARRTPATPSGAPAGDPGDVQDRRRCRGKR